METVARLVIPLDVARASLHHGDDVRYRRAGAHAAAIVLQNCADTGRSYWRWTTDDWALLAGSSAEELVAARKVPTETTVRPSSSPSVISSQGSISSNAWARSTAFISPNSS